MLNLGPNIRPKGSTQNNFPGWRRTAAVWLILIFFAPLLGTAAESMKQQRQRAADRPRPVIFNNDGNEPVHLLKESTAEDLLSHRTAALAGTQVSSIFYCTWDAGFSLVTHQTKVGQVFNLREGSSFPNNRTQELLDADIDPLNVMIEFGQKNDIEIFWSMRMNDGHDSNRQYAWGPELFEFNKFKTAHPEYLFGTPDGPQPEAGGWSLVDYGQPAVRDLAFRMIEEVCKNYDVDGIELDFNRFPVLFKTNGAGQPATDADLAAMTDLMQRVRVAADAAGTKRGRPLLIAVRLPDSVDYCRAIGIDLEAWLANDLVDLMSIDGYFQLNPWDYSAKLGHKYGVKVYGAIDDSRIRSLRDARDQRNSLTGYRAQATNLWAGGVDGIYMFNAFDPESPLWSELGDPKLLTGLDKDYFASVRGVGFAAIPFYPVVPFQNVASLNPDAPLNLDPGKPVAVSFYVGDDFSHPRPEQNEAAKLTLRLQFKHLPEHHTTTSLQVTINGELLADPKLTGEWGLQEKWLEFAVDPAQVRFGENVAEVTLLPTADLNTRWFPTGPTPLFTQWIDLNLRVRFPDE